jgi:hypothetical protein
VTHQTGWREVTAPKQRHDPEGARRYVTGWTVTMCGPSRRLLLG